jgi:hypothetical protein
MFSKVITGQRPVLGRMAPISAFSRAKHRPAEPETVIRFRVLIVAIALGTRGPFAPSHATERAAKPARLYPELNTPETTFVARFINRKK